MKFAKQFVAGMKKRENLAASTIANYAMVLETSFTAFCASSSITDDDFIAAPEDVLASYAQYQEGRDMSGSSIKQHITIIKAAFKKIYGRTINYNYEYKANYKKKKQAKDMERWFDDDEIRACLAYTFPGARDKITRKRNMLLLRLLIETGGRIDEISNIKKKDISVGSCAILIAVSKTVPRYVFFSPQSKLLFEEILPTYETDQEIFPTTGCVKKIVTQALDALGLKSVGDGRGPHTFRHYCATYLYYIGGMDIDDVATLLGDTSDTIKKHYLHPTPGMLYRRVKSAMGWADAA